MHEWGDEGGMMGPYPPSLREEEFPEKAISPSFSAGVDPKMLICKCKEGKEEELEMTARKQWLSYITEKGRHDGLIYRVFKETQTEKMIFSFDVQN